MRFDPLEDLPLKTIEEIIDGDIQLYTSGLIKIK